MTRAEYKWQNKTIRVPDDIELRIRIEPRLTSIGTIPHSPIGEKFAYNATEEEKLEFLHTVLAGK